MEDSIFVKIAIHVYLILFQNRLNYQASSVEKIKFETSSG